MRGGHCLDQRLAQELIEQEILEVDDLPKVKKKSRKMYVCNVCITCILLQLDLSSRGWNTNGN